MAALLRYLAMLMFESFAFMFKPLPGSPTKTKHTHRHTRTHTYHTHKPPEYHDTTFSIHHIFNTATIKYLDVTEN